MAKGKKQSRQEDTETPVPAPRPSKFKEATMNSTTSIHAPPDEVWKNLEIDHLIDKFNEENNAPASSAAVTQHSHGRTHRTVGSQSATFDVPSTPTVAPTTEGALGRFSRAVASFFNGAGASFSALGKRKAGSESAEAKNVEICVEKDDRKRAAEAAYKEAKELGLLPTPKVFVRPVSRARKIVSTNPLDTPTPVPSSLAPPKTPTLHKSPSKKDLQKQKKLSKRVSDLEHKLASARRELSLALGSPSVPPVPSVPSTLPSPPTTNTSNNFWSESDVTPYTHTELASSPKIGKIIKKRKASTGNDDDDFKPVTTDSEYSVESERETKRTKKTPTPPKKLKRKSSARLAKKKSTATLREEVVTVVPDGVSVPPIPSIPNGIKGKKVAVSAGHDAYGGLEHEMF